MRVCLKPEFSGPDRGEGGIRRVVEGMQPELEKLGFTFTDHHEAELFACHATVPDEMLRMSTPLVTHCHGLYWSEYKWDNWAIKANADVMLAIRAANAVTAPTEWVAQSIRRHTMRDVVVVPHGVDMDAWAPWTGDVEGCHCNLPEQTIEGVKVQPHLIGCSAGAELPAPGYVLWNKTRPDPVCDPGVVDQLANALAGTGIKIRSTFGQHPDVDVTGRLSYEEAMQEVKRAGAYLATTRETFGIGTLEALAAGIPVVGWRWGGQAEFIEHGIDGWLARPGDLDDLVAGVKWALENRERIAPAARAKAAQFPWSTAARMYADVYEQVGARRYFVREDMTNDLRPKVSVIVTAYNLEDYLLDALNSVLTQTMADWECIIVDDASPDQCGAIADRIAQEDSRFKVIHNEKNLYLAGARNVGIKAASGQYIIPLDADDMLTPNALELLSAALDRDRTLHIAYGGVRFVEADGETPVQYGPQWTPGYSGWPMKFDVDKLWNGPGQLGPYSSMFRREVLELTGGYRRRYRTAEDQDVWLRTSSYGFRSEKVVDGDCLVYRVRPDSMSAGVWGNHRSWYPWTSNRDIAPAGACTPEQLPIHSCDPPLVSVVIPVGPGHQELLIDAVDSVDAQTYRRWECIVVNDTGGALPHLPSWVRVIERDDGMLPRGAAFARNAGIAASKGKFFLPLDADDMLEPQCIEMMLYAHGNMSDEHDVIVYSDFWEDPKERGTFTVYKAPDWKAQLLITKGAIAAVTQLTPKAVWEEIGGYDETVAWEDWAFQLSCAAAGHCSVHLPFPLWWYRKHTGMRREQNMADFEESKQSIIEKFGRFWSHDGLPPQEELMACRSCGGGGRAAPPPAPLKASDAPEGAVLVEYAGTFGGERRLRGKSGVVYPFERGTRRYVLREDLDSQWMTLPGFHVVEDEVAGTVEAPEEPVLTASEPENAMPS